MSDPSLYTYPSPLEGYENLPPLPQERAADGKSFVNPPAAEKSKAYTDFIAPLHTGDQPGFDVHIYFLQSDEGQTKFAKELWERIRREFPELRIYQIWDKPIGPHLTAMFEVNLFSPAQFGAFIPWLVINRGPLSALVHPNTGDAVRDHSQRATWMGEPIPVNIGLLRKFEARKAAQNGA